MTFYIRSKPLEDNPNSCTPREIIVTQTSPTVKQFLNLKVKPPDTPMSVSAPTAVFGASERDVGSNNGQTWHFFMMYLSRETIKMVFYDQVGEKVLESNAGITNEAFYPAGSTHTFKIEFGDGN